jgi:type I restriction enzyme S subunit
MPFIQVFDVGDDFRLKPTTKSKISKLAAEQSVFIPKGTVIITIQGSIGRVAITQYDAYIDRTLLLFEEFYNEIVKTFFAYVLFVLFEIEKEKAPGGIIKTITKEVLSDFKIKIPKLPEQQKIATCLSSLDEVIAAHSQKLEVLKEHKKGLMQNLFPQEGETVPNYRFPEFAEDGEWVEKKLGELTIKVGSGVTPLGGESVYKKKGRPFVRSQNVGWGILLLKEIVFIDEATHQNSINTEIESEDVLLNITGASIGRSTVANHQVSGGNVNQHVCIIRTKRESLNPYFINQYLISSLGQKQIDSFQAGGNRQGLNFAQIRSLSIPIPPTPKEQQKIASCLSSLDALIAAQAEKIEQLKLHKKGLMQGLFPKLITPNSV